MKRLALLALLGILTLLANSVLGQDAPTAEPTNENAAEQPLAPTPLAGLVVHGEDELPGAEPARFQTVLAGLDAFESLDDGDSIAAVVRVMLAAMTAPGTTIALLDIEDGAPVVAVATPGALGEEDGREGNVYWWAADGRTHFLYQRGDDVVDITTTGMAGGGLAATFADHRGEPTGGLELMLDLENLRRAWPQSLADGPARRVVAVTGLANARKVHVHLPERGPARIAYSSRALPADEVSTRSGPAPVGDARVGVRWPVVFDAGLRVYVVGLGDEPRRAFASSFQQWMGAHGNRLRGVIQALDAGVSWSVTRTEAGLRTSVEIPVRPGVELDALLEAVAAALTGSGFAVEGDGGTLTLPQTLGAAMGGRVLTVTLERAAGEGGEGDEGGEGGQPAARFLLVIE